MNVALSPESEALSRCETDPVWPASSRGAYGSSEAGLEGQREPRTQAASGPIGRSGPIKPTLSVVLATFNERENVPRLLSEIAELGLPPYEVVVVDDGSTDGTREFLTGVATTDGRVRLILNGSKQTLTVAHLQGILAARGEFVVVMDSDLQHPSYAIPLLLDRLERGSDLVIGSRYLPGGSVGGRPPVRGIISRTATLIAQAILPETRGLSDPISGFFGFRHSVFSPFDPQYRGYETILFVLMMFKDRPISEVGYRFQPRLAGESQITQNFGFVRVFLTQVILATRFRTALRLDRLDARGDRRPGTEVVLDEVTPPAAGLRRLGQS